jgi:hypothetical protein
MIEDIASFREREVKAMYSDVERLVRGMDFILDLIRNNPETYQRAFELFETPLEDCTEKIYDGLSDLLFELSNLYASSSDDNHDFSHSPLLSPASTLGWVTSLDNGYMLTSEGRRITNEYSLVMGDEMLDEFRTHMNLFGSLARRDNRRRKKEAIESREINRE